MARRCRSVVALLTIACGRDVRRVRSPRRPPPLAALLPPRRSPQISAAEKAPPASQTGGFDGAQAYDYTAKLVSFGPRPPASDAIHRTQDYIRRS